MIDLKALSELCNEDYTQEQVDEVAGLIGEGFDDTQIFYKTSVDFKAIKLIREDLTPKVETNEEVTSTDPDLGT